MLTAGTDRAPGYIQLVGGSPDQPLCVSARRVNDAPNRPAIVERCGGDPAQLWYVQGGGPTTISNDNGECITVRGDSPSEGDLVRSIPVP